MLKWKELFIAVLLSPLCSVTTLASDDIHKFVGHFKVGSPYRINGKKYIPEANNEYVAEGVASWYGPAFHGKQTANGAVFDKERFTAAHRTLQMPCVVRVTNLENGKSLEVMVNDRGPFTNKLIDLSYNAAEALGFAREGVAKVRVEYLHNPTLALLSTYPDAEREEALRIMRTAQLYQSKKVVR